MTVIRLLRVMKNLLYHDSSVSIFLQSTPVRTIESEYLLSGI